MTAIDELADQLRRAIEQVVLFRRDECDLVVVTQSRVKRARRRETAQRFASLNLCKKRRAAQREQSVVRKPAKRRTQHGRKRDLVSLVIQEAQQLNEIRDLFAFIEPTAEHSLIRNVCATKHRLIDLHLRHGAKEQSDIAVLELVRALREREDAARELLRVEHSRILFGARIVFERRLRRHEQLDEWTLQ